MRQDSQHGGPIRQRSQAVRSYKPRSAGQGNRPGHVAYRDGESSSSSVGLTVCGERSSQLQSWEVHGIEQDILHVIEFSSNFFTDEKVALFDRLKVNRKARRESKDICRLLLTFRNGENVAKVYDELQNRSYKPRQDGTLFQNEEKDA